MDFVAIDFETANNKRESACAVGIITVKKGKIVDKDYHLFRPSPFFFTNTSIHGISEEDVKDEESFAEKWMLLRNKFDNQLIVAHNAAFDLSVLRYILEKEKIPFPNLEYICTWRLSQVIINKLENHRLSTISNLFGIELNHHHALSDAEACAKIALCFLKNENLKCLKELSKRNKFKIGKVITPNKYKPFSRKTGKIITSNKYKPFSGGIGDATYFKKKLSSDLLQSDYENADPNSPFYMKKVVFTGSLAEISRKEAAIKAKLLGADIDTNISKKTNFVVAGNKPGPSKMKKIKKYNNEGSSIEIINEFEFFEMISF